MVWWDGREDERIWVEVTSRPDLGADLKAPDDANQDGSSWRYSLFRSAQAGDRVLHYRTGKGAGIVGASVVAGLPISQPIVWKARGSSARKRGDIEELKPGYTVPLENYRELSSPITAQDLERKRSEILSLRDSLKRSSGTPYMPFAIGKNLRPAQGYAFVLPASFVELFPQLASAWGLSSQVVESNEPPRGVAENGSPFTSSRKLGQPGPPPSQWSAQTAHVDGPTAVYLMQFGTSDAWKIGISQNPHLRCSALNFSVPSEVLGGSCWALVEQKFQRDGAEAYRLEQKLLMQLSSFRTANERVRLSKDEMMSAWSSIPGGPSSL
jgi:hypothetical protein